MIDSPCVAMTPASEKHARFDADCIAEIISYIGDRERSTGPLMVAFLHEQPAFYLEPSVKNQANSESGRGNVSEFSLKPSFA